MYFTHKSDDFPLLYPYFIVVVSGRATLWKWRRARLPRISSLSDKQRPRAQQRRETFLTPAARVEPLHTERFYTLEGATSANAIQATETASLRRPSRLQNNRKLQCQVPGGNTARGPKWSPCQLSFHTPRNKISLRPTVREMNTLLSSEQLLNMEVALYSGNNLVQFILRIKPFMSCLL